MMYDTLNETRNASQSQFKQTLIMFAEYLDIDLTIDNTLSYAEWLNQPDSKKAAFLFVAFYPQIVQAWYRVKGNHTYEEDGVDEAMHICSKLCGLSTKRRDKNAPVTDHLNCKVEINRSTYTPAYIYSAMRNAFSSLNYSHKSCRSQYQHPEDNIVVTGQYIIDGQDELDIFESIVTDNDIESEVDRVKFWNLLEADEDSKKVVVKILKGHKLTKAQKKLVETMKVRLMSYNVYKA